MGTICYDYWNRYINSKMVQSFAWARASSCENQPPSFWKLGGLWRDLLVLKNCLSPYIGGHLNMADFSKKFQMITSRCTLLARRSPCQGPFELTRGPSLTHGPSRRHLQKLPRRWVDSWWSFLLSISFEENDLGSSLSSYCWAIFPSTRLASKSILIDPPYSPCHRYWNSIPCGPLKHTSANVPILKAFQIVVSRVVFWKVSFQGQCKWATVSIAIFNVGTIGQVTYETVITWR